MAERTGGANAPHRWDVLVVGGGCAGLTAAIAARHRGCSVLLLDAGPLHRLGGNTRHARNTRLPTSPERSPTEEDLARFADEIALLGAPPERRSLLDATTLGSSELGRFMRAPGVGFQRPYAGVIEPDPAVHFLVGGGLALVRAYRRSAERLGVVTASDARVIELCPSPDASRIDGVIASVAGRAERIDAHALIIAAGGAESDASSSELTTAVVRGGAENTGVLFELLGGLGARFSGEGFHVVPVDDRSPRFDGGVATRVDAIAVGAVVDRDGRRLVSRALEWPSMREEVGAAVARAAGGRAAVVWDSTGDRGIVPTCWPAAHAPTLRELAHHLGLDATSLEATIGEFNAVSGANPKRAAPIIDPPFFGMWIRPGITFGYRGLLVDADARVIGDDGDRFRNVFAAGEAMAGSIRPSEYCSGLGLTIAGVWGRIAARSAADAR